MTLTASLSTLQTSSNPSAALPLLKDLKNSVIGNVVRKVEVAKDEQLLHQCVQQSSQHGDGAHSETAS
jgi:hypothetical protein